MKTLKPLNAATAGLAATLACAGLLLSMPASASELEGYAVDSSKSVVRSNFGECWRTSSWSKDSANAECDPNQVATAPEPAPVVVEPRRTVQRINLASDAYFAFNKADLRPEGKAKLDEMALHMQGKNEPRLQITGYTDRIGTEAYNMQLSQRRAEAVKDYLVSKGIEAEIIETTAMGPKDPVVNCEGKTGNALIQCLGPNRRTVVEFSAFEVIEEVK
jgi:OOP family OmpA-OmpF porin